MLCYSWVLGLMGISEEILQKSDGFFRWVPQIFTHQRLDSSVIAENSVLDHLTPSELEIFFL
jgi:hypothetical protein